MAVSQTNNVSAKAASQPEPKQAPKSEPKKPQDNTAATQAPGETKAATKNAFGDVPKNDGAKQADDAKTPDKGAKQAPKLSITAPKDGVTSASAGKATGDASASATDPKSAPASDTKAPPAGDGKAAAAPKNSDPVSGAPVAPKLAITDPKTTPDPDQVTSTVDPKIQSILDTKLPDGKSVKEKLDADAPTYIVKAAQDHYKAQKDKGEALDAISKFYLNLSAKDMAANGVKDAKITPEKLADIFNVEQINKNLEELSKDPDFAKWATEQQANSVQKTIEDNPDIAKLVAPYKQEGENYVNALRRMQSDYMSGQDFADGVATAKDGKTIMGDAMKTLSSFGLGEKELLGVGNTLAENIRSKYTPDAPKTIINPETNKAVATEDGYNLAVLPDGTHIALGTDGKPVADKQGNPYVYNADRTAKVDANNAYVQYHAKSKATFVSHGGTKYMLGADGKTMADSQGRPLAIDNDGGAPVALGKDGKALADKAGNKLVFDPNTGKAVTDPGSGNAVVIDPDTKGIVQADGNGKVIAGKNGDPYAADPKTGKFVQDAQGRYVQLSKDNVAPDIQPGYVIDANNTRIVVSPANGKPIVDPATGKTVIFDPKTSAPQLVPLDSNGVPKLTQDGKNIVYDETGHTVVPNEGKGPSWLVNADGNYVQNAGGNYIGVDAKTGLAAPVDENGFVKNGSGHIPVWDTKTNAQMATPNGDLVVVNEQGNLLAANAQGQTYVEEKSGLPFLLDPKTKEVAINPDTGRSILLSQAGLPVEYNADDGHSYLINPETNTTVKTADGNAIVTDGNGMPYAIRQDGSAVRNPDTGNAIVYGTDGLPAKEQGTGYNIEITSGGKAHVIDPKTNAPMAERDPKTGGYQLYNKDGSDVTNPESGNKIQMVPDSGLKVEIDPATNKPVSDAKGHPLLMGEDNRPLKTPGGNVVVADLKTGLPVTADANGKLVFDPVSKLPLTVNIKTGVPLADPETKAPVVVDPKSRQPVQVDKDGKIISDPVTGMPVAINNETGAQIKGPDGALAVNDPRTGLPVYYDQPSKLFTVVDPDTSQPLTDPATGAKTVVDTGSGMTFNVLPDAQGNHIIVDKNGQPVKDDDGTQPYFDKNTGKIVVVNEKGEVVEPKTGKAPEKMDPKSLVYTTPFLLMGPPAIAVIGSGYSGGIGNMDDWQPSPYAKYDRPWEAPNFKMSPDERNRFARRWDVWYARNDQHKYSVFLADVQALKLKYPALGSIPDEELIAVRAYTTGNWFNEMNEGLYKGDPFFLEDYDLFIRAVKSGMTHLEEAGFTYKGMAYREMDLAPAEFKHVFGGQFFENHQFWSTSLNKKDYYTDSDTPANTKIKVKHLKGIDVRDIEVHPETKQIIGTPGTKYALSDFKPAGSKGDWRTLWRPTKYNTVTMTELPADFGKLLGGNPDSVPAGSFKNVVNWSKLGKVLGYAGTALDIGGGAAQVVFGGLQLDEGIKNKDPYDIASGAINIAGGGLAVAGGAASIATGVAAAAAAPLAGIAAFAGMITLIIDILKHQDDHNKFADSLGEMYDPLGILNEGWHDKAAKAYYDSQGEPDPAPIAHGNLP